MISEEERAEIQQLLSEAEDWLYDTGLCQGIATVSDGPVPEGLTADMCTAKQAEMKPRVDKIIHRVSEFSARPEAIEVQP